MSAEGERESLKYRLLGSDGDIGSWGHEYVRVRRPQLINGACATDCSFPYAGRMHINHCSCLLKSCATWLDGVWPAISLLTAHNAEPEAVDLLMEVEDLDLLVEHGDKTNFKRTCLYLTSSAKYLPGPNDILFLDMAYMIYMKFEEFPRALQIALCLNNLQYVKQIFTTCNDLLLKKQFCYILARHEIIRLLVKDVYCFVKILL